MSLNPFLPAPVTPPVTDSFTLGTVTQLSPLRVQRDGDTAPTDATPINTFGPLIVGDRVWCQLHGKALLVVGSVTAPARDLYLRNFKNVLTGGGHRQVSSSGVKWTERFTGLGAGRGPLATQGYWQVDLPPDGTVIPVIGHTSQTSATVSGGVVPLINWQTLWYEPPFGSGAASDPSRFHITSYLADFEVPSSWVPLVSKNGDTNSFFWLDGRETALWQFPTPSSPWSNYGSGYANLAYKRENGIVYLGGLIKGSTTTATGTIFVLPVGYRPALGTQIFLGHASGGISDIRVYTSGTVSVAGFLAGGNANDVALSQIRFPADT